MKDAISSLPQYPLFPSPNHDEAGQPRAAISSQQNLLWRVLFGAFPTRIVALIWTVAGHLAVTVLAYQHSRRLFIKGWAREPWPEQGDGILAVVNCFLFPFAGPISRGEPHFVGHPQVGWVLLNSLAVGAGFWLLALVGQGMWARRKRGGNLVQR